MLTLAFFFVNILRFKLIKAKAYEMSNKKSIFSGALMVSGVSIGAGMLGVPVKMAQAGFLPTILLYVVCWALMTLTGLLYVEACLWFKKEVNLLTLTEETLGKGAKSLVWLVYIFLFFSLIIAYVSGGGEILVNLSQGTLNPALACFLFVALFLPVIFKGTAVVDKINAIFMFVLIVSFFFFIFVGSFSVNLDNLNHNNSWASLQGLPVVLTAFGFQGLVPTLVEYFNRDRKALISSILLGSLLSFIIYVIWIFLILGIVPLQGADGLLALSAQGKTAIGTLFKVTRNPLVFSFGQAFGLAALVTSFLGVALPLVDFLADGLKAKKTTKNKLWLVSLVLLPPLGVVLIDPSIFLTALSTAGAYGGTVILGFLPIAIVWVGREKFKGESIIKGRPILVLAFIAILFVAAVEFFKLGT
jgi:tyrosine-specific transport protein